jgi:hypothetical protein
LICAVEWEKHHLSNGVESSAKQQHMHIRPGILIAIAAIFAVLIGGRFLGWYGGKPAEVAAGGGESPAVEPAASTQEPLPLTTPQPRPSPVRPVASATQPAPVAAIPQPASTAQIADWEERIDSVLTGQGEEGQKARQLLALFPNLPEDGQVEAAQHISNLLPDEEYASLAQSLTNAAMPEAVLDVLMTDVLNRPNQLKLETLYEVARMPGHPKAEEARDVLEVFVDENYGEDWAAWKAAIDKWLKENPDE